MRCSEFMLIKSIVSVENVTLKYVRIKNNIHIII